ncbi:SixA phosphatase family protein [Streptomyces sp. NPDC087908]|uniref:SixA phosphatase family protein n=1 Tax=Streptomyces sp. NPDC087908 TaxID=3365820 RepID=UPI00382F40D4
MRHAKSAWPEGVADRDRPLGPRGLRDAPASGRFLADSAGRPDLVVCSPARRARGTWELAAAELDGPVATRLDPRVYGADATELLDVLHGVPDEVGTLLLVGHNPGLEELVLLLAAGTGQVGSVEGPDGSVRAAEVDADAQGSDGLLDRVRTKFPTSAIAVLTWHGTWSGLGAGGARLADLAIPRGARRTS